MFIRSRFNYPTLEVYNRSIGIIVGDHCRVYELGYKSHAEYQFTRHRRSRKTSVQLNKRNTAFTPMLQSFPTGEGYGLDQDKITQYAESSAAGALKSAL